MKRFYAVVFFLALTVLWVVSPAPAVADSSHARIVRLSLVQGDVRFAREFHRDSLTDTKTDWEVAPLNLPIRQGYAVATDNNGRAEVEFENGAMAFLSANTLIEFYDLSLEDGALITRLVLRQGSAIFYVHPAHGDFFTVTGGDFSVEANGRTRFRLDNFDDGSAVNVEQGRVAVLHNKESKPLEKGQSYSINMNEGSAPVIGRSGDLDDFDKWVSGRIDSVATATTYASQYVSSSNYSSGFADLYNYGSFYNVPGYGYGWQPFGMGLGWCPFNYGNWNYDPFFGWNFIGSAPWGWLPYHYGGWVFSPVYGWVWVPSGLGFGGPVRYRPVTAVWVHSGSTTGLVPLHPADTRGKSPLNLGQGVYALRGNTIAASPTSAAGENWSAFKQPSRGAIAATALAGTHPPTRVSRTILSGNSGVRAVTLSRDSSIVYDAGQHRFVNGNGAVKATPEKEPANAQIGASSSTNESATRTGAGGSAHTPNVPTISRGNVPARPNVTPPRPPSSSGGTSHSSSGATWSGGHSSGSSASSGSSVGSSHTSSSAGHSSGGHH
ncbi:MAG: FecR family protein [Candidatus Acidiferrum sp.]